VIRRSLTAPPILATCFALLWSVGQASLTGSAESQLERILEKSNTVAPPPYRALRRLEGGLMSSDKRGWMEVWTEYLPARGFTYEVVGEGGSDYVRDKIFRALLTSEQKLIATGKRLRTSLESKNYEFADAGLTDAGLQRILLKPAKKSDGILNGSLLLEPATGLITRMEGRLVKSPSFWLRDVDVTYRFAHVAGYVVPIEMTSAGRVRMFGRSNFKMTYDYVSIDGQPAGKRLNADLREQQ
jgi:hypothetical protein